MQWTKRYTSGQRIHFTYVFLFGFFVGAFIMNLWKSDFLTGAGFLDEEMLYQMKYTKIDSELFFFYVLKKRLFLFFIIALLATTYLGIVVTYGAILWFGFAGGMIMAAIAIRYGLKGIFLILASFLPHYILYIPAFFIMLNWCYRICCIMYFPARVYEQQSQIHRNKKMFWLRKGVQFLLLVMVVIIGILLESYVNPVFLTNLLKIF